MAAEPEHPAATRSRRLAVAIVANVGVVVAQVVFGLTSGSLGLLSDAGHNLTDVAALVLSWIAVRVARRAPTQARSFGWHRGTILVAQANAAAILAMTVWIGVESIQRLADPPAVEGGVVLAVALLGFVVNAGAALVVRERHDHGHGDLNMRSATLHLMSDAAASLGVAVAGAVMLATDGWAWLDPAVSLGIGVLIGVQGWRLLGESNAVLLEGTPTGIDPAEVTATMAAVDGVEAVHDLHVWAISSEVRALSAHVVVEGHPSLEAAQEVAGRVKAELSARFHIAHATIELECETCTDQGPACDIELVDVARTAPSGHGNHGHHGHHHLH